MSGTVRRRLVRALTAAAAVALAIAPSGGGVQALAQEEETAQPALLLIMDSSGSMAADDGTGQPKIAAAKDALRSLVAELPAGSQVGLRVYGHRVPNTNKREGCRDTELVVPVGPLDKAEMRSQIAAFEPTGFTPIGLSLREGAADLPPEGPRTIILVSDGIDTCAPPDPCEVAAALARREIDITIETVGFQVDPRARRMLRCIARVAGGSYTDASDAAELAEGLRALSLRALRLYEPVGTPVSGTPAPDAAPVLASGQYVDRISPDEELWYGVELAEGQAFAASATMVVRGQGAGSTAVLRIRVFNPQLEQDHFAGDQTFGVGQESESVVARSEPVAGDAPYEAPGRYFFAVSLEDERDDLSETEYPLEIVVTVTGEEPPLPTPTPTEGAPTAAPAPPPAEPSPDEGPRLLVALGSGLLGFIVGATAVAVIGRRRAR